MVNNTTNINKSNNHISPQATEHEKPRHMTFVVNVLAWNV